MQDDETTFYLTERGWQREGEQPADCLAIIVHYSPNKMYSRAYFGTAQVVTGDKSALEAAYKAHGREPRKLYG
jgi:hypothetical protein